MLSKEFSAAFQAVWDQVGGDVLDAIGMSRSEPTMELVCHYCLTRDNLETHGGEHGALARDEFFEHLTRHGWNATMQAAIKSLPYPLV